MKCFAAWHPSKLHSYEILVLKISAGRCRNRKIKDNLQRPAWLAQPVVFLRCIRKGGICRITDLFVFLCAVFGLHAIPAIVRAQSTSSPRSSFKDKAYRCLRTSEEEQSPWPLSCAALERASKRVLEPIMTVEISAPVEFLDVVLAGVNKKRGTIVEQDDDGEYFTMLCRVALNEMFGYAGELRSITEVSCCCCCRCAGTHRAVLLWFLARLIHRNLLSTLFVDAVRVRKQSAGAIPVVL